MKKLRKDWKRAYTWGRQYKCREKRKGKGQTRTHTLVKCDTYFLTLKFTGMTEDEIHAVLETVRLNGNAYFLSYTVIIAQQEEYSRKRHNFAEMSAFLCPGY